MVKVVGLGAGESVDALSRIAHQEQVGSVASKSVDECQLRHREVLGLVDQQMGESPPCGPSELGVGANQFGGAQDEVGEVDSVASLLGRGVGHLDCRYVVGFELLLQAKTSNYFVDVEWSGGSKA
jgi:hypothetical protein